MTQGEDGDREDVGSASKGGKGYPYVVIERSEGEGNVNVKAKYLSRLTPGAGLIGLCHVGLRPLGAAEANQIPACPVGVHQLFLDDVMIERMDGFQRVVNPVVKHRDNPLVAPEKPWEVGTLILDNAVVYDEAARLFKMYCLVPGFATGGGRRTSYLTSVDGIRWERPELGLVEYEGSTNHDIERFRKMESAVCHLATR